MRCTHEVDQCALSARLTLRSQVWVDPVKKSEGVAITSRDFANRRGNHPRLISNMSRSIEPRPFLESCFQVIPSSPFLWPSTWFCYLKNSKWIAMIIQHTPTYGLKRSPIRLNFQQNPVTPVRFNLASPGCIVYSTIDGSFIQWRVRIRWRLSYTRRSG